MSKKLPIPSKEALERAYLVTGATLSSASKEFGTSHRTFGSWLDHYDIPKKDHKQASQEANARHRILVKPSKAILETLHREHSQIHICKIFGVTQATVKGWLKDYEIENDHSSCCKRGKEKQFADIRYTKEEVEEAYDRSLPLSFVCDKLGVSSSYLKTLFRQYEIVAEKPWRSRKEIEFYDFLVTNFPKLKFTHSDKKLINPFELDIVCYEKKIAIEYCGLYWHSEFTGEKKPNYHAHKRKLCLEKGFKLITIFESDDEEKVKALLLKLFGGVKKRVYARDIIIKTLTSKEAMKFAKKHHLHNGLGSIYHYGLFYDETLVMSISFSKTRFNHKFQYECARMVAHSEIAVLGGASKLFKHFIREVKPESIITYADLRFGDGLVYSNHCGFTREKDSAPNYWYFHKKGTGELFSRVKFQKHKLNNILDLYDEKLTEADNMRMNGWDRIWDCGNAVYVWRA